MTSVWRRGTLTLLLVLAARAVGAQTAPPSIPEELEPRVVGAPGLMTIGFGGFVDHFNSSETAYPVNYTVNLDLNYFLTRRIAVRGGLVGAGSTGGDDDAADGLSGSGALALHAGGGAHFYFTPDAMLSFYTGLEYWSQITQRAESDAGSAVAKLGLQAALSSRASVFLEGGYGINLRRGDEGETVFRLVGQLGLRIRF